MSDDAAVKGLLPPNSSALERAVDLAFGTFIERVIPPFPELMDPQHTPADFLSYLAADRGVLGWSTQASTESKRATVLASWGTKRLAGTRWALSQALKTTGFTPRFAPWYEAGAPPYTLVIFATSEANQTAEDYQNLGARLEEAKSERDDVVIRIEKTIPLSQRLYLAQITRQSMRQGVLPELKVTPSQSTVGIATALQSARMWTLLSMSGVSAEQAPQLFGGVMQTATIIRVEAFNG